MTSEADNSAEDSSNVSKSEAKVDSSSNESSDYSTEDEHEPSNDQKRSDSESPEEKLSETDDETSDGDQTKPSNHSLRSRDKQRSRHCEIRHDPNTRTAGTDDETSDEDCNGDQTRQSNRTKRTQDRQRTSIRSSRSHSEMRHSQGTDPHTRYDDRNHDHDEDTQSEDGHYRHRQNSHGSSDRHSADGEREDYHETDKAHYSDYPKIPSKEYLEEPRHNRDEQLWNQTKPISYDRKQFRSNQYAKYKSSHRGQTSYLNAGYVQGKNFERGITSRKRFHYSYDDQHFKESQRSYGENWYQSKKRKYEQYESYSKSREHYASNNVQDIPHEQRSSWKVGYDKKREKSYWRYDESRRERKQYHSFQYHKRGQRYPWKNRMPRQEYYESYFDDEPRYNGQQFWVSDSDQRRREESSTERLSRDDRNGHWDQGTTPKEEYDQGDNGSDAMERKRGNSLGKHHDNSENENKEQEK